MQTLLATQQKTANFFTPAPFASDKRTASQVEIPKALRSEKSDVIVQIIVANADRMIKRGAQMLVHIQDSMRIRSKREGRIKSLLIQMPRGKRGP
jgi:hypothetical protein